MPRLAELSSSCTVRSIVAVFFRLWLCGSPCRPAKTLASDHEIRYLLAARGESKTPQERKKERTKWRGEGREGHWVRIGKMRLWRRLRKRQRENFCAFTRVSSVYGRFLRRCKILNGLFALSPPLNSTPVVAGHASWYP